MTPVGVRDVTVASSLCVFAADLGARGEGVRPAGGGRRPRPRPRLGLAPRARGRRRAAPPGRRARSPWCTRPCSRAPAPMHARGLGFGDMATGLCAGCNATRRAWQGAHVHRSRAILHAGVSPEPKAPSPLWAPHLGVVLDVHGAHHGDAARQVQLLRARRGRGGFRACVVGGKPRRREGSQSSTSTLLICLLKSESHLTRTSCHVCPPQGCPSHLILTILFTRVNAPHPHLAQVGPPRLTSPSTSPLHKSHPPSPCTGRGAPGTCRWPRRRPGKTRWSSPPAPAPAHGQGTRRTRMG